MELATRGNALRAVANAPNAPVGAQAPYPAFNWTPASRNVGVIALSYGLILAFAIIFFLGGSLYYQKDATKAKKAGGIIIMVISGLLIFIFAALAYAISKGG